MKLYDIKWSQMKLNYVKWSQMKLHVSKSKVHELK